MFRRSHALLVCLLLVLPSVSCAKAPPNLTPQATTAFYATQVIKGLDLVRDFANDASHTTPPVITGPTLLKVVNWHEALVRTVHAAPGGGKATALQGLDQLATLLTPTENAAVKPYVDAAKTLLQELP